MRPAVTDVVRGPTRSSRDAMQLERDRLAPSPFRPPDDDTSLVARVLRPFQQFFATEAAGGIVLVIAAIAALVWSNWPGAHGYFELWERTVTVGTDGFGLAESLHGWINDGLMVVFFLLVGLEIKRELLVGELSSLKQASLPIAAAFGGMLAPAAIYAAFNATGAGARGWGIPMATDIAFALGVLALLGNRVPVGLRVFLAALAIVDDIGAVLVIAVFYTAALSAPALVLAAGTLVALVACNRLRVRHLVPYALLGVALWLAVLHSGIHATVAGVLLAATIPFRTRAAEAAQSPALRLEQGLHKLVAFVIMPLFAFANAGVQLTRELFAGLSWSVVLGVGLGLVAGKVIGISLASRAAVRMGIAALPNQTTWRSLFAVSWLGGIGFTMSLFIATLAFGSGPLLDSAKVGILGGSLVAGSVGAMTLLINSRR